MKIPQPIPYHGSKRNLAKFILLFFPDKIETLIEPFAGSCAISLASAYYNKASRFHLNDINAPLVNLWHEIIHNPDRISRDYERLWNEQGGREREYYDFVRDKFNKTKRPHYLLYLLARCVKAAVRYNPAGEFNQSPDNRRKGRNPKAMREGIFAASNLLQGRTIITSRSYEEILQSVSERDLVYMDPPYQGVSEGRDRRYYAGLNFGEFLYQLEGLVKRRIPFILSYDAKRGEQVYGRELPTELGLYRKEIKVGRSTQSTLLGRNDITYESIYLPPSLLPRFNLSFTI